MSWRQDVVWLHRCILTRRSTSLISWGSQCCRLKVVRYRSLNCWMISTVRSTTPYHVTTSTRSVTLYGRCFLYHFYSAVFCDILAHPPQYFSRSSCLVSSVCILGLCLFLCYKMVFNFHSPLALFAPHAFRPAIPGAAVSKHSTDLQ